MTIVQKLEWNRLFFIFLPLKRIVESFQNNNGKREKSKLEVRFKELFPVFARASLALILTSSPLKLVCFNCFPNTGHVIILQRTVSFKLRLVHVHMHV